MTAPTPCEHFKQPPLGVTLTATAGPFVCPWCEIERLERELDELRAAYLVLTTYTLYDRPEFR